MKVDIQKYIQACLQCQIKPHEATKCTPYELVFSKLALEASSEPLSQNENLQTYDDYLINFLTQLHEMQTQVRKNLIIAKEKSIMYHDG